MNADNLKKNNSSSNKPSLPRHIWTSPSRRNTGSGEIPGNSYILHFDNDRAVITSEYIDDADAFLQEALREFEYDKSPYSEYAEIDYDTFFSSFDDDIIEVAIRSDDELIRALAISRLSEDKMLEFINDDSMIVRREIAFTTSQPELLINDEDYRIRAVVASRIDDPSLMMNDDDYLVRKIVAERIDNPYIMINDDNEEVRDTVVMRVYEDKRREMVDDDSTVISNDVQDSDDTIEKIHDEDPYVRYGAVFELKDPSVMKDDDDAMVREAVVGRIATPEEMLYDSNMRVIMYALKRLRELNSDK